MKNFKIKARVKHSNTKFAFNVIGTIPGMKYKLARIPYFDCDDETILTRNKNEALEHAEFIRDCFNNNEVICKIIT